MAICPSSGKECEHYKKKRAGDPRIRSFIEHYHSAFILKFQGQIPTISGAKDANSVKRMLVNWSLEELKESLPEYFDCQKAFYIDNSYDLCRFEKFIASKGVQNGQKDGGSGGRTRNFAEERQKQRDESNARILSKYNRVPGGVHRETACGEGKGNVVIENDEVSFMAVGPLRTIHGDSDE